MFQRVLLDFVLKTFGLGAENETRTRDPNLGKVVLYQLSYFRKYVLELQAFLSDCECKYRAKKMNLQNFFEKNLNYFFVFGAFFCPKYTILQH